MRLLIELIIFTGALLAFGCSADRMVAPDGKTADHMIKLDLLDVVQGAVPCDAGKEQRKDKAVPDAPMKGSLWAISAGGSLNNLGEGIAVDSKGNNYVSGSFQGRTTFGNTTLTSNGNSDIFVAKVDPTGKFIWAQSAGGTLSDSGAGIAVDSVGNIYMTGAFQGTVAFGSTTLTSKGSYDIFVAKVDPKGKFIWAKSAGEASDDFGAGISVDSTGNSYITGSFYHYATFDSKTVSSGCMIKASCAEIFVAKVDPKGEFLWVNSAGGPGRDVGTAISVDGTGNSYVMGEFTVTTWGPTIFGATYLTKGDSFVAKVDPKGKFIWAKSAGWLGLGFWVYDGCQISVDNTGNSYITGRFRDPMTLGANTLTSRGSIDIYVAKVGPNGKFIWATSAGGTSLDSGIGISVDSNGNSYVMGDFSGTATFGATTLTSKGESDIFVAKVNSSGKFIWAQSAGGTADVLGRDIAVDSKGNSYVSGSFSGSTTFGTTTLSSNGNSDIFVWKLGAGTP